MSLHVQTEPVRKILVVPARHCGSCFDWRTEPSGAYVGWCFRFSMIRMADQTCEKWCRHPVIGRR